MKRVFLSFQMEDKKQVDGIRLLKWNSGIDLEFYDESVRIAYKSQNAGYIRQQIKPKILRASITLCLLGRATHQSEWVDWELATSIEAGNKIILMGLPNGPDRLVLPPSVKDRGWLLWDLDALSRMVA